MGTNDGTIVTILCDPKLEMALLSVKRKYCSVTIILLFLYSKGFVRYIRPYLFCPCHIIPNQQNEA
jgi:hypothetical protein